MQLKSFFVLLLLWRLLPAHAQVTFSVQAPLSGLVQKSQLWNMILVNTSNRTLKVNVGMSILNAKDNRPVLNAVSGTILLNNGARQLSSADLAPVQYSYLSPTADIDRNPDGFLPIGNYKICYTLSKTEKDQNFPLAEDCILLEVAPLAPPQLNMPADTSVVETSYPQFSWLPATPYNLFSDLNYNLVLVEVMPGQSKTDAIQKNIPLYNASSVRTVFHSYPTSAKSLDTSRLYAWKVIAKNGDEFAAQTEVWTFRLAANSKPAADSMANGYAVLSEDLKGEYLAKGDNLFVKYTHNGSAAPIQFTLTDTKGNILRQENHWLIPGENFLRFPLNGKWEQDKSFLLSVFGSDNKKQVLRFRILQNQ